MFEPLHRQRRRAPASPPTAPPATTAKVCARLSRRIRKTLLCMMTEEGFFWFLCFYVRELLELVRQIALGPGGAIAPTGVLLEDAL